MLGNQTPVISSTVDSSLLGGMTVALGDKYTDMKVFPSKNKPILTSSQVRRYVCCQQSQEIHRSSPSERLSSPHEAPSRPCSSSKISKPTSSHIGDGPFKLTYFNKPKKKPRSCFACDVGQIYLLPTNSVFNKSPKFKK